MTNKPGKHFYVEVGEFILGQEESDYYDGLIDADGLYWSNRGGTTDSFPEVEARSTLLAKTYKNVRIASNEIEVIAYVEN